MIDHEPTLLQTLKQHRSDINSCDFSCGTLLATASADKTVRLWNWQPGLGYVEMEYSPLKCHKYGVTCVRFSPQGTMVASSSIEGTSKVHAVRDGVMTHCLTQPSGIGVRVCRFSPDSCILATGADDGMICIWDLLQKNIIRCISYHEGAVQALSFTADGVVLLGACTQGVLSVFSIEELLDSNASNTQPCLTIDDAHDLGVLAMDLSPIIEDDDSPTSGVRIHQVVTSGHDQLIRLWKLRVKSTKTTPTATLDLHDSMLGHTSAITCVRFSSDGELIASACLDRTVRIWTKTGRYRTIHAHTRYVNCVAFSKDGTLIATGSNDKTVNIWDVRGNLGLDSELVKPCTKLSHFGAGDLLGIGPAEGALADLVSSRAEVQQLVSDVNTHGLAVNGVCFSGDHTLATACSDKLIRLFHWSDLEGTLEQLSVSPLVGHKYAATAVNFTPDGSALFSCSLDGTAILWDVQSGERLMTLGVGASGGARAVAVSPSRTAPLLIAAGDDALTPMWRLGEDEEPFMIFSGHADAITCVAFSSDGCALVSASQCGDFRLYRAPERDLSEPIDAEQLYMQTNAHDLGVLSCDFCPSPTTLSPGPDVQILATSGNDSLGKIWILTIFKTSEPVKVRLWHELVGHGGSVTCVRFEPGMGNLLTTGATDKQTRVWCASTGRCMHVVSHKSGIGTCSISSARLLAVGCLDGSLHLHRLPPPTVHEMTPDEYRSNTRAVASWTRQDVDRWITDNCAIGSQDLEETTWLERVLSRAKQIEVTGSYLMSHTEDEILEALAIDGSSGSIRAQIFSEELHWVKSKPKTLSTPLDPPHQYLCPITHQLMTDPVKCADGFTYERSAIYEWFLSGGKLVSPMTNQALINHSVSPNFELRRSIRQYLQAQSENPKVGNIEQ